MTAEVAILNKQAVAMAADSAVTTGRNKIFNTVNKLFALSKWEPVGIMVYSSAEIMDVPVETVIKEFRRQLHRAPSDHIEDYATKFDEFLREDKSLFSDEARMRSLCSCVGKVANALVNDAYQMMLEGTMYGQPGWKAWTKKEFENALEYTVGKFEGYLSTCDKFAVAKLPSVRKDVREAIESDLARCVEHVERYFPVKSAMKKRLKNLFVSHLFHKSNLGGETGIVIAGFGQKDLFPALKSFEFHCSALGLHNSLERANVKIDPWISQNSAQICPFAQRDVVDTFIVGCDPGYVKAFESFLEAFMDQRFNELRKRLGLSAAAATELEDTKRDLIGNIGDFFNEYAERNFVSPLMEVVDSMPKEELAVLAESLVNLTAMKRKASPDAETVGGPTDVAVISKGDGFIWIKRKHYFDSGLNPTFNVKYMEDYA